MMHNIKLPYSKKKYQNFQQKGQKTADETNAKSPNEYCSTVWHPWQKYLVYKLKQVQRPAARYIPVHVYIKC
jgi:hypothetical protein